MRLARALTDFAAQCGAIADWAEDLSAAEFARPSVLDGWDVRTLLGHLVLVRGGLVEQLGTRADGPATPLAEYVARYRPAAGQIAQRARDRSADLAPSDLIAGLRDTAGVAAVAGRVADRTVVQATRGPIAAADWVATRLVELAVHCDDLSRSLPERDPAPLARPVLAAATRTLAEVLAAQAPGHSVEVRVPPFVAVQAVAGPRHTRGTPANVVETDPLSWLRLATGRLRFAEARADGRLRASGNRADLSPHLPVLS